MMNEDERVLMKVTSFLLSYPDADWLKALDSMKIILEDHPDSPGAEKLLGAVCALRCKQLLQLQEEYTRLFDFSPATSLNLTHHKWGDGKERGTALACFKHAYTKAGFSLTGGELPDYLPLSLEFLSACPDEGFLCMLKEYEEALEGLALRLENSGSEYAQCLRAILEMLAQPRYCPGRETAYPAESSAMETGDSIRRKE